MAKLVLNDIASLTNETSAINTINNNSSAIETAFDNTLSRDGTTPNQMQADLDMNGRNLLNVGNLTTSPPVHTPASSTDNAIVRFDGTGGNTFQNSGVTISDTNVLGNASVLATGTTTARTLEARFAERLNVKDFGAVGDGTTNDASAIQAAIDALPATGGTVFFPPGNYKINSTITLGNGTSSAISSRYGMRLEGAHRPQPALIPTFNSVTSVKITWGGGAATMFDVLGPLQGWGLENLYIDGASTATLGLRGTSAQYGECRNLTIVNCLNDAIRLTTFTQGGGLASVHCDSFHNLFVNTNITVPNNADSCGIRLTSIADSGSNSDFNTFINTTIGGPGGSTSWQGIILGWSDGNNFYNTHMFGGSSAGVGVRFDYGATHGPVNNNFYGIDCGTNSLRAMENNGTPPAGSNPNCVYGFAETNGASFPIVDNLNAYNGLPGPTILAYTKTGVNMNSVADTIFNITLPKGYTRFRVSQVAVYHASVDLTSATTVQYALYTQAAAGGTAVITPTASTVSSTAANTSANAQYIGASINASFNTSQLFFRVTTAHGSAGTADVTLHIQPLA